MNRFNPRAVAACHSVARAAGIFAVAVGACVLAGWMFDIAILKSIVPGWATMKANTAAAFLLSGVALWFTAKPSFDTAAARRSDVWIVRGCSTLVALIGGLTLVEYFFGVNPGIDGLLFQERAGAVATTFLGRMSPVTAADFLLLGVALLLPGKSRIFVCLRQGLVLLAVFGAFIQLAGYLYDPQALLQTSLFTSMAAHTAVTFVVLAAGVLCARPRDGVMALFTADSAGGSVLRRLLLPVMLLPVLMNWVELLLEQQGNFPLRYIWMVDAALTVFLVGGLVWAVAWVVHRKDVERRVAEDAEQQSEVRYRTLFEQSPAGVVLIDAATQRMIDFNTVAHRQLGYSREEFAQLTVPDFEAAEKPEETKAHIEKIVREGRHEFESCHRTKQGEIRQVLVSAQRIESGGRPVLYCLFRDITERQQAEQELKMFRMLVDRSSDGIEVVDPATGQFLDVNQRACLDLGYTREEYLSLSVHDIDPMADAPTFARIIETLRKAGSLKWEGIHRRKDGRTFPVEVNMNYIELDQPYAVASVRDITERKQAQEQIQLLAHAVETTNEIISITDLEDRFTFVNQAFLKAYGYRKEEIIGQSPKMLYSPANPPGLADEILSCSRSQGWRGELLDRRKDGSDFPVSLNASPIRDVHGQVVGLMGMARDITEQKRAGLALRESETRYRTLFEVNPHPMWVYDLETLAFLAVNDAAVGHYGFTREEFLAMTIADIRPPEDVPKLLENISHIGEQPVDEAGIWRHRKKDGSLIAVEITSHILDYAGRRAELVLANDVTKRQRAEAALRESQAFYQSLVDQLPAGVFRKDTQGRYVFVSPGFCRLKGTKAEEFLGKTAREFAAGATAQKDTADAAGRAVQYAAAGEEHHQLIMQTGKPIEIVEEYEAADGRKQFLHVIKIPVVDPDGKIIGTQGILFDITESKRVEQAHARLAKAVEQSADTILITDTAGAILYVNPAFEKTSGYTCAEVLGQNPRILKSGKQDVEFYRRMWDVLKRGEVWQGHFINKRKDGTLYDEEATISPVRDVAGMIINYVAAKRDVTHEMQLDAQFRQSQKMEGIGQLAGGVAHDFNNILTALMMQVELAGTVENTPEEVREGLREIRVATERAASLTRQLLLFSRRQVMQPRQLDLNESVTTLAKMLQRIIGEDVSLQLHLHSAPLMTCADAGMLDQLLMNLAVNARDAMPQGGRLIIETSEKVIDAGQASLNPEASPGRHAWLSVSDTGCGIPPEILPHIFEPFFTTKEAGKGTGLGLATVFGIVKQHKGWVKVYSEPGKGTTFQVCLPASDASAEAPAKTAVKPKPRGGSETILLVEDEPAVRMLTRAVLERQGYHVLEATNGVEAQQIWTKHQSQIALLLTDLVMPGGVDGRELAARLRTQNPKLKVIFTSGYSAELAGHHLALQAGQKFIQKPCPPDQLLEIVRNCLDS